MSLSGIEITILLAYISLIVELVIFPVPSVASTYQLVNAKSYSSDKNELKGEIGSVRKWDLSKKMLLLILPACFNIILFLAPLFLLCNRDWLDLLFPFIESSWPVILLGLILIVLGRLITFSSVLQIRKENSQRDDQFKLHQKSFFKFSRNPGLVGMYTFFIGLLLIFPSTILLAGFMFYVWYMHYKVKLEEDFLSNQFGDEYHKFMSNSKRYV